MKCHEEGKPNEEYSCRHLSVTSFCPAFGLFCRNLKFGDWQVSQMDSTVFYCLRILASRPNSAQGAALLSTKLRVLSVLLPQLQKRGTWSLHGTMMYNVFNACPACHLCRKLAVPNLHRSSLPDFLPKREDARSYPGDDWMTSLLCKQLLLQVPCIHSHHSSSTTMVCWEASHRPGLCAQSVGAEVLAHWWQHWRKGVLLKLGIFQSHTDLHQDSDDRLVCDK